MKQVSIEQLVRPIIKEIIPYRSARDEFEDFDAEKIFLDANENPFENGFNRYPDPLQRKLKRTLADVKQVKSEQILLGNGSDEVLDLIFRTFCEPGEEEVLILPPTYGMYSVLAKLNNIIVKEVPLNKNFEIEIDSVLEAVNQKTKIIFICSPNNPSGNAIPLDQIEQLLDRFKGILVVDEAYIDFSEQKSALSILDQYPQLLVCQTFSKAYGLAGIRLGMCYANPLIIDYFNKIKPPYNVNSLTQSRALAQLETSESIQNQVISLISERKKLEQELKQFDFVSKIYPSDANFLLVVVDDANKRYDQFLDAGVVLRNRSRLQGCNNALRVTVGTPEENTNFIKICKIID
ncbi:MAG: histidinol-phosphate transaminase [Flavobacteriaceae bacterium]